MTTTKLEKRKKTAKAKIPTRHYYHYNAKKKEQQSKKKKKKIYTFIINCILYTKVSAIKKTIQEK
jgi:hypothetical protein